MNIAENAQIFWDPNKPDQIVLFKGLTPNNIL